MDNHYHLLIETPDGNLLGMRQLNGVYTQRFNRRHRHVGHLFQGRFKAILVERESYLLELCRYVVLNPIRAKRVNDIRHYAWSSYQAMLGKASVPDWLSTDWLLSQFGKTRVIAQQRYAVFVAEGKNTPSPWKALKGQLVLGTQAFLENIQPQLAKKSEFKEHPRHQRLLTRPDLTSFFSTETKSDKTKRDSLIHEAYLQHGYTMAAIAKELGIHYSSVSKILRGQR